MKMKMLVNLKILAGTICSLSIMMCATGTFAKECNNMGTMFSEGISTECEKTKTPKVIKFRPECVDMEVMLGEGIPYGCQKGLPTNLASYRTEISANLMFLEGIPYGENDTEIRFANSLKEKALTQNPLQVQ